MNTNDLESAKRLITRLVAAYNAHDLDALMGCFGDAAAVEDQAWGDTHQGPEAIRKHFASEFEASRDIHAVLGPIYASSDEICFETRYQGTHTGDWRGIPATGNPFDVRVWAVARSTAHQQRLKQMRFDYDRATVLQQLGLLHDLQSRLGAVLTALTHPVTMAKAARRRISERPAVPH